MKHKENKDEFEKENGLTKVLNLLRSYPSLIVFLVFTLYQFGVFYLSKLLFSVLFPLI